MEIRPPQKPNYTAIAQFLEVALGASWSADALASRIMADPHFDPNLVLMAKEKGEILGFLVTVLDREDAWVKLIAVHPSRRNQGLAREMIERAEERLFGEGARTMRAGFGPGPLFYPGVPEGGASDFFLALGYQRSAGGIMAQLQAPMVEPSTERPLLTQAKKLMQAVAPHWWNEVEECLSFDAPHVAMSEDGEALCLAEPLRGIGPLFYTNEASALQAVEKALAIAGEGSHLMDFRGPAWWETRFKLSQVIRCFEFQKDLRGVFHA